jgi:endonuclease/exonuclease/phosphatase family metal-dependent hydrolase
MVPALHRPTAMPPLRLLTYNIRQCTTAAAGGAVDRVARVIADTGADVVALQEVAVGRPAMGGHHQAAALGERLGMFSHFQRSMLPSGGGEYGNAVLSRFPFTVRASGLLPLLPDRPRREPRGASWLALDVDGVAVHLFVTHLGLARRERHAQLDALLGDGWLGHSACVGPRVLCGDLNFVPGAGEHRRLLAVLGDALQRSPPAGGHRATFPALRPLVRLDHVFVSPDLAVRHTRVVRGPELRRVSDHLPVLAELEVPAAA